MNHFKLIIVTLVAGVCSKILQQEDEIISQYLGETSYKNGSARVLEDKDENRTLLLRNMMGIREVTINSTGGFDLELIKGEKMSFVLKEEEGMVVLEGNAEDDDPEAIDLAEATKRLREQKF